jgi:hypothetical protein
VAPQQGLTNLELRVIDAVPYTTDRMNGEQLNIMAAAGTWIVTQNPATGTIYTRHQLTTGQYGNLNESEDSLVTNLDSVSYRYLRFFEPYTGRVNVTDEAISQLKSDWNAVTQLLQSTTDPMLGPQLAEAEIVSFDRHPLFPDRILVVQRCHGPYPFNNFDVYLVS